MTRETFVLRIAVSSVLAAVLVLGASDSQVSAQVSTSTDTTTATTTASTSTPQTTATTSTATSTSSGQATTTSATTTPITMLCEINRTLTTGSVGEDVRCLQKYLNQSGFQVAVTGFGSPGNETAYYGSLTQQAVMRWQNAYASQVLVPLGLPNGTGVWGNQSRTHYESLVRNSLGIAPTPTGISLAR